MVEAIIFDFDNTVANTDSIKDIRESGRYEQLTVDSLQKVRLYRPVFMLFQKLRQRGVRLAIVTNSGERYIRILFEHLNLQDIFEVIITYGDVRADGKKPSPKGLGLALDRLGIAPSSRILYVGDDNNDQLAAYKAGITPILPTWASRRPISIVPAMAMDSKMLLEYVDDPEEFHLFAEQCAAKQSAEFQRKGVYFLPLDDAGNIVPLKSEMASFCLGRYYSQKGATTAYLHDRHPLSKEIASKSECGQFNAPKHWIDLLTHVLRHSADFSFGDGSQFDIVTVIPGKRGKDARMERILQRVRLAMNNDRCNLQFFEDMFFYVADALSQKTLARHERQFEANRALHLNPRLAQLVQGKRVLIIDDVLTSGATLARARELLGSAGAARAMGVVLAKTVSILEDERVCPVCERMMRVRRNSQDGTRFWGCSGYYDDDDPCEHTEPLVKKKCPHCSRVMRISTNRKTGEKFWGCSGYNQTPTCNYTESVNPDDMPS